MIDGEDEAQLQWAKIHKDHYVIILVKGKPLTVEESLGVPIYFDQGGHLCKTYKIQQIPGRIEATGEVLTITEFKVEA